MHSVERFADVAETARDNLARHGISNVEVVVGDGTGGLPEHAPYDAILVLVAYPSVPLPLVEQLVPGGRLVQPIGSGGREEVVLFEKGPRVSSAAAPYRGSLRQALRRARVLSRMSLPRLPITRGLRRRSREEPRSGIVRSKNASRLPSSSSSMRV